MAPPYPDVPGEPLAPIGNISIPGSPGLISFSQNRRLHARERSQVSANEPRHFLDGRRFTPTPVGKILGVHDLIPLRRQENQLVERSRIFDFRAIGLSHDIETPLSASVRRSREHRENERSLTLAREVVNGVIRFHGFISRWLRHERLSRH